jgi:4-oxalmesaconate hydratase
MIIDCHGHFTTAPKALEDWRQRQIASLNTPALAPSVSELRISDDELRDAIASNQLRLMRERDGSDDLLAARVVHGAPHRQLRNQRHVGRHLQHALPPCQRAVPRPVRRRRHAAAIAGCRYQELHRRTRTLRARVWLCRREPESDPSGGHWTSPPLSDPYWYPIYEKLVELDVPAMIHVSTSCNACFHTTGAHYLNADTTAFMQVLTSDLFQRFPTLKFVIPHGGGAVPYHWGRFRGLAQEMKLPPLGEHLLNNVFFDTCVYHQPGIDLLTRVIPVNNVLFASEMIGAVRGIDPETGHYYDDTRRYIDQAALSDEERHQIYEGNARRVYSRLDARLKARGH